MRITEEQVQLLIKDYDLHKRRRQPWDTHWQVIGEYVYTRKADFTSSIAQGDFLNDEIFDSTAPHALEVATSALIGALWPNGARSMILEPTRDIDSYDEEVKEYFEFVTQAMGDAMDNPRAGLMTALEEYMTDQLAFGTSGVAALAGDEDIGTDIYYRAWDVKHMVIDEGRAGFIDTIFYEKTMSVRRAIAEYGRDSLSAEVKEKLINNDNALNDDLKILHIIKPRLNTDPGVFNNLEMPYMSLHLDLKSKHVMRESGFEEMPVKVARFAKRVNEIYGRSPSMKVLPEVLELNAIWEAVTIAIEKQLDPPLAVESDAMLGNASLDTSAGAINVLKSTGRIGDKNPIFPLFTVGDVKAVEPLITKLEESISNRYGIDRLLDLNNETEMTLGEAQIRDRLRAATLRSLFSRQIAELFNPLIERTFNVLFKKGKLGVIRGTAEEAEIIANGGEPVYIPDTIARKILQGKDIYKIKYITPAMRMMQSEEIEGLFRSWEFVNANAGVAPDMVDVLDPIESVRSVANISGVSSRLQNSNEVITGIQKTKADAAARQQQLSEMATQAKAMQSASQAVNSG